MYGFLRIAVVLGGMSLIFLYGLWMIWPVFGFFMAFMALKLWALDMIPYLGNVVAYGKHVRKKRKEAKRCATRK
jgi:hypothetical protein